MPCKWDTSSRCLLTRYMSKACLLTLYHLNKDIRATPHGIYSDVLAEGVQSQTNNGDDMSITCLMEGVKREQN